jgi:hypothetical protein
MQWGSVSRLRSQRPHCRRGRIEAPYNIAYSPRTGNTRYGFVETEEFVLRLARGMIQCSGLSCHELRLGEPHGESSDRINTSRCTSFEHHRYNLAFYTSPFFPPLHSFFSSPSLCEAGRHSFQSAPTFAFIEQHSFRRTTYQYN